MLEEIDKSHQTISDTRIRWLRQFDHKNQRSEQAIQEFEYGNRDRFDTLDRLTANFDKIVAGGRFALGAIREAHNRSAWPDWVESGDPERYQFTSKQSGIPVNNSERSHNTPLNFLITP